jgi:cellulose synthase/poly-beta-1,6-N-acetylglucosamine synthase-like glycosyltransferase
VSLWSLLLPGFASPLEGHTWPANGADRVVFVALFCALVDFVKLLIELLGRSSPRTFESDPSQVTAVIACRNGAAVLPGTIAELRRTLPGSQILVVDDGSSDETTEVARKLGCLVHRFERGKGKASAVNYAIHRVRTPLVLLLDDDTRLGGARFPTSLITSGEADAVAFRVLPDRRNRDGARGNNFLGSVQRYEYAKSMEIGKRFHDVTQSVSCVSGAIGLFRTADLGALHHRHTTVFQGEDLQRTMIHLLEGKRIVFADEPVWTVAPSRWAGWFRQRLFGWYPGLYHQLANMLRLLGSRRSSWRLRYEMAYNVYTVISDPLKTWSIFVILLTPGLRIWGLILYVLYLAFETFPWWVIRMPGKRRHAPIGVLLFYPLYGAINTLLRTIALPIWAWLRYVTGNMRPRRGPLDRVPV